MLMLVTSQLTRLTHQGKEPLKFQLHNTRESRGDQMPCQGWSSCQRIPAAVKSIGGYFKWRTVLPSQWRYIGRIQWPPSSWWSKSRRFLRDIRKVCRLKGGLEEHFPIFKLTKRSPHPISLGEGVDYDGQPHGGHHTEVGECEVHHKHVGGSTQGFDLRGFGWVLC